MHQAVASGLSQVCFAAAAIGLLAGLLVVVLLRRPSAQPPAPHPPTTRRQSRSQPATRPPRGFTTADAVTTWLAAVSRRVLSATGWYTVNEAVKEVNHQV
jgi:dipeptide/tripeptide permease